MDSKTQKSEKIPCSVGVLTLNSAGGIRACLESLKDFEEIIVCDGNSTDGTADIARAYGARVIKQYDTDEPETPCIKDKAAMRQRNMEYATKDWYFFMDADDTLSPEVVQEIREIVTSQRPDHYIWRMPTRIFIDGKEIKHEATYPSYQTRLVHRVVNAKFKGEVHDRLVFDESRYTLGTLQNFYNFHWSKDRVDNLWSYFKRYADWELDVMRFQDFSSFLYWGIYKRLRTILGYILWRLPKMYLKYGANGTMPLWIELTIVRYHLRILWGSIKKYFLTLRLVLYTREILRGKDMNRALSNIAVMDKECYGKAIDIGGGTIKASHYRFLRITKWFRLTTLDISPAAKPDVVINLEEEKLPFKDGTFDFVLAFNILEHLSRRKEVLEEARRVLKPGGELIGVIPFLVNVHPDPNDYVRFTDQGLESLFKEAGFSACAIKPVGFGPFTAGYYQLEFVFPKILKLVIGPIAMGLDMLLNTLRPKSGYKKKFPLSYVFYVRK